MEKVTGNHRIFLKDKGWIKVKELITDSSILTLSPVDSEGNQIIQVKIKAIPASKIKQFRGK